MKIQTLARLFPYFPVGLENDIMNDYRRSIQNSTVEYKILFYISEFFCRVRSGNNYNRNAIFNYEIGVLDLSKHQFILQKYLFHVYKKGSKTEEGIINNKEQFYNFCIKNQLPTPRLIAKIKNGEVESLVQGNPWDHVNNFFIKPVLGSQSKGILELTARSNNTFEIVNQNRMIKGRYLVDFIKFHLQKGEYIVQEKAEMSQYFAVSGHSNVPIIRLISIKAENKVKVINPVLIINKERNFLNSGLKNKDFHAINATSGMIIGGIVFQHVPTELSGFTMPDWDVLLGIIKKAHSLLGKTGIIGWDVAVTEGGYSLLEANTNPWLEIHQKSPFESSRFIEKILNLN